MKKNKIMRKLIFLTALAVPVFLASCGGDQTKNESATSSTETTDTLPEVETPVSNTIEISGNDQMKFNLQEIKVKAGEQVTLTLKNNGTLAKQAMGHNFVLLAPGTDVEAFAMKAMTKQDADYIPSEMNASILAHTKLLGPGESDTITFTVPKGEYEFICSFPGHWGTMRGKLIAE